MLVAEVAASLRFGLPPVQLCVETGSLEQNGPRHTQTLFAVDRVSLLIAAYESVTLTRFLNRTKQVLAKILLKHAVFYAVSFHNHRLISQAVIFDRGVFLLVPLRCHIP
jgi:hypothetical protein